MFARIWFPSCRDAVCVRMGAMLTYKVVSAAELVVTGKCSSRIFIFLNREGEDVFW